MSLNDERVRLGRDAVAGFTQSAWKRQPDDLVADDLECAFFDMLVALRHYARSADIDYGAVEERAAEFFGQSLVAPEGCDSRSR